MGTTNSDIQFTARARLVLTHAEEEARRRKHNYIGTEHILWGLTRERDGVGARVLLCLSVDLSSVQSAINFIISEGRLAVQGEIGLTPRVKRVMTLATEEVRRSNYTKFGTEYLLIGLLLEGEGVAAGILETMGVTVKKVRSEVLRITGRQIVDSPDPADAPKVTDDELADAINIVSGNKEAAGSLASVLDVLTRLQGERGAS